MIKRVPWLWSAMAITAAACSSANSPGDGGTTGGNMLTAECGDAASALCAQFQSCSPAGFGLLYADLNACQARWVLWCGAMASANGSGATHDNVEQCAQAIKSTNCDELISDLSAAVLPSGCNIQGSLMAGAPCAFGQQCPGMNGYCNVTSGQNCGTCGTRVGLGQHCNQYGDCQAGLTCNTMSSCVAPADMGAQCDAQHPCKLPFACVKGMCATPAAAGGTCDPNIQNCEITKGYFCNVMNVCVAAKVVMSGAACGLSTTGDSYTSCQGAGTCPTVGQATRGTCPTVAADGDTCDPNGIMSVCEGPAQCIDGKCGMFDASSCH